MTNIAGIYFYTLKIAFFSTLIALLIAFPMSFFTAKRNFWGRKLILASAALPLCVPTLIVALGYVNFFGVNGSVNKFLGSEFSFLYSIWGIVIAQGFYNFPFVTGILTDAWEKLPREQENAARLLGTSEVRVFFTITLKQLSGALAAACIPVFLFCFFSFMIVMLFSAPGVSTLEVEIYHSIRTSLNLETGIKLALLESITALVIVFFYSYAIRHNQTGGDGISFCCVERKKTRKVEKVFLLFLLILVFFFFFCPLLSVFFSGLSSFSKIFFEKSFWTSLLNSILTGFLTASLCVLIAFSYSLLIKLKKKQSNPFFQTIPLVPMAISSVIISWSATLIFHRGNVLILVIIQTLLFWPVAYRQIQNGLNRISIETDNAALLLSASTFDSIIRIYLPSCIPVLLSAFVFSFAMSIGDATMPLILSIKDFNTLSLYTYKLAGAYRFSQACACGSILAFISLFIVRIIKK